jgi:transposase InsO family protein
MPWQVQPVSELRSALVHAVLTAGRSVAAAARDFGVSRKTADKWVRRARDAHRRHESPELHDRSRRPQSSPARTADALEQAVLQARRDFGWGPRKLHAYLLSRGLQDLPSARTVANILRRHGLIAQPELPPHEPIRFQRSTPNDLWQCDFKGPLEVARRRVHPFTVLDDHSRYLIALEPCADLTMATAFAVLWRAFGECGLPATLLCDNAFATTCEVPRTLSWFDARLIRLGITPIHGRPYHPQTQGKVERLHRTLEDELWPSVRRDEAGHFAEDLRRWRTEVYNPLRPHEALGDRPPAELWRSSPRVRPACLPEVEYPAGALVRKVCSSGDVRWRGYRILAGRGLVGQYVRIEERAGEVALFYSWKQIRCLCSEQLQADIML